MSPIMDGPYALWVSDRLRLSRRGGGQECKYLPFKYTTTKRLSTRGAFTFHLITSIFMALSG
jgi:hypothetical protein